MGGFGSYVGFPSLYDSMISRKDCSVVYGAVPQGSKMSRTSPYGSS